MSVKRIRKVDPIQSGKVTAIISIALSLVIIIPAFLFFSSLGLNSSDRGMAGAIFGGGIMMVILGPLLYGFFGFIAGILYALVYNVTYRFHGGLQLEYDDLEADEINRIGQS